MCGSQREDSKYVKQKWAKLKGEINNSKIIVDVLNSPLLAIDRTSRQKISKEIEDLNNNINLFSNCSF